MINIYDHRGYFTREYVRGIAERMAHGTNCTCERCAAQKGRLNTRISPEKVVCKPANKER